jgi:hypothetical protein
MTDAYEREMARLADLDLAVRCYLSHLWAVEQGSEDDEWPLQHWLGEMARLTGEDDE